MSCIAVLDVGKTNKKSLLFNSENLSLVAERIEQFPTDTSADVHVEQAQETRDWFFNTLKEYAKDHDIRIIGITTHGATFACMKSDGSLASPVVSYTTDPGDDFQKRFYAEHGNERDLHREFATPAMGVLLNISRGIAWIKENYPDAYAETEHIVPYPQYFVYQLCGISASEATSVGCHSYLYDFEQRDWSRIIKAIGCLDKMPKKISKSYDIVGNISQATANKLGLNPNCQVIAGAHDSNASLVPYLIKESEPFALNSTGTWCIGMCQGDKMHLNDAQLDAGIYYNINVNGDPVKTGGFMGGAEHGLYEELFKRYGINELPAYDKNLYQEIINNAHYLVMPGVQEGNGLFPASASRIIIDETEFALKEMGEEKPSCLDDPVRVYAALNISLAIQTAYMLEQVDLQKGMRIYIEGGFRKNPGYIAVLSALLPDNPITLSDIPQATAFGTALLCSAALNNGSLSAVADRFSIERQEMDNTHFDGLLGYRQHFLALAGK